MSVIPFFAIDPSKLPRHPMNWFADKSDAKVPGRFAGVRRMYSMFAKCSEEGRLGL